VQVIKNTGYINGRSASGISITAGEEEIVATNLLICTGSEALIPPIPGLSVPNDLILTNREILDLKEMPESLVVIGGGLNGVASFFNSLGTRSYHRNA
jgi:dihydrolipoamide dehydrogenase